MSIGLCRHCVGAVDGVHRSVSPVGTNDHIAINADVVPSKRHEIRLFAGMRWIHPEH